MARTVASENGYRDLQRVLSFSETSMNDVQPHKGILRTRASQSEGLAVEPTFRNSRAVRIILLLLICGIFTYCYKRLFGKVEWKIVDDVEPGTSYDERQRHVESDVSYFDGFIYNFLYASTCGLAVFVFTWMMTFMDSVHPGVSPPTPLSPRKLRELSGHTFHVGYMMAIINGFTIFVLAFFF